MLKNLNIKKKGKRQGFTLIEVIIGTSLILIVFFGIFGVYQLTLETVSESRAVVTALAITNQRMETIKNTPYHQIGVVGGIPVGPFLGEEIVVHNQIEFTIRTTIIYIDDPFDGLAPVDTIPTDYKRIEIRASWPGFFIKERFLVTNISPKGREVATPGGTLSISVFNAIGFGL